MYNVGDKILYPPHGAGVIEAIEERVVLGKKQSYYIMRMPYEEMTVMIHGEKAYEQAIRLSQALFSGKVAELTKEEIAMGFEGIPQIEVSESIGLIDALVLVKAASSKREARDFINGGGVSINGVQQKDMNFVITNECTIGEDYTIIRRGKKNYYVIKHVK